MLVVGLQDVLIVKMLIHKKTQEADLKGELELNEMSVFEVGKGRRPRNTRKGNNFKQAGCLVPPPLWDLLPVEPEEVATTDRLH
jgi:hypothetical protein